MAWMLSYKHLKMARIKKKLYTLRVIFYCLDVCVNTLTHTPLLEHWFRTLQSSYVMLILGERCGLAVWNHPARCLCSGVMCLSWPGDFLLPEALKVITVEEDLSSAATCVWSSPQHFTALTLPEITAAAVSSHWKVNSIFLPFINVRFNVIGGYNHHKSFINSLNSLSSTFYMIDPSTVYV